MNIIIVGQGAMGLLWYHHIQQVIESNSDYDKTQLHLLPSNKVVIDKQNLSAEQYTFTDSNNLRYCGNINYAQAENIQTADIIILCLKSFQIASALKEMTNTLKDNASIVLAHNGMGTLNELPQHIVNRHNIYALLTTHGCLRTAPLTIVHTGVGNSDIGLLSGTADLPQQQSLITLLNSALPRVEYHEKIKQKQWLKLAINCVINPLTAIDNVENGQINNAKYAQPITSLLREIVSVANAEGIELKIGGLKQTVENVAKATAKNSSSMRCDILKNRKSEIDYISGYIHLLGMKHGIATPSNTKMWQKIKQLEA